MNVDEMYEDAVRQMNAITDELRQRERQQASIEHYQYQYSKRNEKEDGFETGEGMVPLPVPVTVAKTIHPGPQVSPSLPEHVYVRQEGAPQKAEVYDAATGKHVENVREIQVTLNGHESKVRVVANDGERTYPVQDLTVDANGAEK